MIISHKHRFIFAAIPKTGTHSVRRALRAQMGPDDLEQVGLFVNRQLPFPDIAKLQHGHISFAQIRPHLGADVFNAYFKFAFVRNPFDRFVSYCAFKSRDNDSFARDPRAVMWRYIENPPLEQPLFAPQHSVVADANGALLADWLGRVETMQADYDTLAARLGFPATPLERVNSTQRQPYRGYYDNALIDAVSKLYRDDLDLFGYEF